MSVIDPKANEIKKHRGSRRPIADIEGAFAIWYAKLSMATCSSATWERYHAARRWVLLRCRAVCCGGRASFKSAMPLPRVSVLLRWRTQFVYARASRRIRVHERRAQGLYEAR